MTVASTPRVAGPFTGTGANAALPFVFKVFEAADLLVQRTVGVAAPVELVLDSDYTVALNADQDENPGGTVTILAAANTLASIVYVTSQVAIKQEAALRSQGGYYPKTIEDQLDRIVITQQQLRDQYQALADQTGDNLFGELRAELAATGSGKGAGMVAFDHSATYPRNSVGRKLQGSVNPYDYPFNATGNGSADDWAAVQGAIDFINASPLTRHLFLPGELAFALSQPLVSDRPLLIRGEGTEPYNGWLNTVSDVRGQGSWLHPTHLGKGLVFSDTVPMSGVQLEDFGFFRDQPTPGPGWVPTDYDYDLHLRSAAAEIDGLMFLGSTRGINCDQGNYGKLSARRIRGQFFKTGIHLDKQYDLPMIHDVRAWGYKHDKADVLAYQKANLDMLYLRRVDNAIISDIFSIAHRSFCRIGKSADDPGTGVEGGPFPGGTCQKVRLDDIDADIGKHFLWVDSTVDTGCSVMGSNITAQGDNIVGSAAVMNEGDNSTFDFDNVEFKLWNLNAVRSVGNSGNKFNFSATCRIDGFNMAGTGFPAVEISATDVATFDRKPEIYNDGLGVVGPTPGGSFGPNGTYYAPGVWRSFTATLVPTGSGAITGITWHRRDFELTPERLSIDVDYSASGDTGTGQHALGGLPASVLSVIGSSSYISGGGGAGQLLVFCTGPTTSLNIISQDGSTYPGAPGRRNRILASMKT